MNGNQSRFAAACRGVGGVVDSGNRRDALAPTLNPRRAMGEQLRRNGCFFGSAFEILDDRILTGGIYMYMVMVMVLVPSMCRYQRSSSRGRRCHGGVATTSGVGTHSVGSAVSWPDMRPTSADEAQPLLSPTFGALRATGSFHIFPGSVPRRLSPSRRCAFKTRRGRSPLGEPTSYAARSRLSVSCERSDCCPRAPPLTSPDPAPPRRPEAGRGRDGGAGADAGCRDGVVQGCRGGRQRVGRVGWDGAAGRARRVSGPLQVGADAADRRGACAAVAASRAWQILLATS
jgi:hypothetical protein